MMELKFIISVLLILALILYPTNDYQSCSYEIPLMNFTVVLDAGHGGTDGGAIGLTTMVREKDINLSIAKKTAVLFESAGADVVLTRSSDDALCEGKYSKLRDMEARKAIVESANPYIVISIHCNSFPKNKSAKGAQTFYYPGSVSGEKLAECIQKSLSENLDSNNSRNVKSEDFYLLRIGKSTNVMVECGFLSSPEEELLLCDNDYQNKIAYAVFNGTSKYIAEVLLPGSL